MRFFLLIACEKGAAHSHTRVLAYFESVWEGSCGRHVPHVLPHSPLPHARVDSECKRWNLEHVVLDLFSHFTLGKVQVLLLSWLTLAQLTIRPFASCEPHSCRRSQASPQRPHLAARPPPCAARASHRIRAHQRLDEQFLHSLQLSWKLAATCNRHTLPENANSCSCASSTCALASESHRIAYGTRTRGHRLSMKRRPIECALMDQSFRTSSCPTHGHDRRD